MVGPSWDAYIERLAVQAPEITADQIAMATRIKVACEGRHRLPDAQSLPCSPAGALSLSWKSRRYIVRFRICEGESLLVWALIDLHADTTESCCEPWGASDALPPELDGHLALVAGDHAQGR